MVRKCGLCFHSDNQKCTQNSVSNLINDLLSRHTFNRRLTVCCLCPVWDLVSGIRLFPWFISSTDTTSPGWVCQVSSVHWKTCWITYWAASVLKSYSHLKNWIKRNKLSPTLQCFSVFQLIVLVSTRFLIRFSVRFTATAVFNMVSSSHCFKCWVSWLIPTYRVLVTLV